MYLSEHESKARRREAEKAQSNRREILAAVSQGKISRRELVKMGLFTAAGAIILKNGLSPFARTAFADSNIPTGLPPSPLFGVQPFTQPMLRFDVLPRNPVSALTPAPTAESNQTQQPVPAVLGGGFGPVEGRPPGPIWAHQQFDLFPPKVAVQAAQAGAQDNLVYNPTVPSSLNSGIDPTS